MLSDSRGTQYINTESFKLSAVGYVTDKADTKRLLLPRLLP